MLVAALFALAWSAPAAAGSHESEAAPSAPTASQESEASPSKPNEAQRRAIFRELGRALKRAQREAMQKYADEPQSMARIHYEEKLTQEYRREIAAKHGISTRDLVHITVEGFEKHWHVVGR